MNLRLLSDDVDETVTVGGPGAEVTVDEALGQIPPRPVSELMPGILSTNNSAIRMVMMYHAALSHIEDHGLWAADSIEFSVDLKSGRWDFRVSEKA